MPPATIDVGIADANRLGGEHDRLEAGATDLVNRQRRDIVREPASERGLPSRRLSEARGHDVAQDAFLDVAGIDAGSSHGLGDDHRAELRGAEVLQRTEELAGRRANGGDDDGVLHGDVNHSAAAALYRQRLMPSERWPWPE